MRIRDQFHDAMAAHGSARRTGHAAGEETFELVKIPGGSSTPIPTVKRRNASARRDRSRDRAAAQTALPRRATTALDVVVQRSILQSLDDLRHQLGFGVVFITHDLSLLVEIADRIAVMYAGALVEEAPGRELHEKPAIPTRPL